MRIRAPRHWILIMVASSAFGHTQSTKKPEESFVTLIKMIPTQDQIAHYKELLNPSGITRTEFGKKAELELAESSLNRLKEAIPKLRDRIKVGESVFEYPGLLSRGEISFHPTTSDGIYRMYIGVYLKDHEGTAPYDFQILFDSKGVIREVSSVAWKH